ncbi:Snurportin 1 [Nesidiocoris tenuis]|uniref:Snurportin-1 n=1 Tax=Nesidiocoris tenuis TaxID=355587 RepID=A0ABN7B7K2_9HEMI|nr:Snurportin 1 [Nesidiocoris tenuis]
MDEILESLSSSARITLDDDDLSLIHPRYADYKPKKPYGQAERRRKWVTEQKEKRCDNLILNRKIGDLECEDDSDEEDEAMAVCEKSAKKITSRNQFKNCLMMSCWLVDVPEEFATDWYYLICPRGQRAFVVASHGKTTVYSRRGHFMMKFNSALPGGNYDSPRAHTAIDCIYSASNRTFYVIDVLVWGIPLTNCSAELRFFWLMNKFAENPELSNESRKNQHKFVLLNRALVQSLPQAMDVHPVFENNEPQVDGIIFFHREGLYVEGKSLLVTWLLPFMVQDILHIPVHEAYKAEIPINYESKTAKMDTDTS